MPTPEITPGAPCWADLTTSDLAKAKEFYAEIFGWTYETGDQETYGGYTTASKEGAPVAGLMQKTEDQAAMPDVWSVYLASSDINATTDAVAEAGGNVFMPPMEVPEQGHMAMFSDAGGAVFGVWQPGKMPGFSRLAEPGSPVWFELHTRAYEASVDFYRRALGWQTDVMSDTPEMRYTTLGAGREAKAGIFDASSDLPEGMPNNWQIYWGVEDADEAEDTPFGRLATLTDPTGAVFKIMQDLGQGGQPE